MFSGIYEFNDNLREYKCLYCEKKDQQKFDKILKEKFGNADFLTMIQIGLFYCCEKVFVNMNTWIVGKDLIKNHYHRNKIFIVT